MPIGPSVSSAHDFACSEATVNQHPLFLTGSSIDFFRMKTTFHAHLPQI